jgi:hypothetical protein
VTKCHICGINKAERFRDNIAYCYDCAEEKGIKQRIHGPPQINVKHNYEV